MKKFILDQEVSNVLPELAVGVLVVKDIDATNAKQEQLATILNQANTIAKKYVPNETISENEVVKAWRTTYQKFPTKKGARCSIEALLKRVLHDNPVGQISPSVDITNAISLKYAFPIGVENIEAFVGDLHLGICQGDEDFLPIGSDKQEPPLPNEIAYKDDAGIVCRCLNWRDGVRTSVSDETTHVFIAMECVQPERLEELNVALDELATLMKEHLNATICVKGIVDGDHPILPLE